MTEKQHSDNKPQAADEEVKAGAEDSSHETGVECYECLDPVQNCPPPDSGFSVLYRQNLHEQK